MLRSIFSLIQRIIDSSEKQYNNSKSKAVLYCWANASDTNMETGGKRCQQSGGTKCIDRRRPNVDSLECERTEKTFSIQTDQGDVITCKHNKPIKIQVKSGENETAGRVTFSNPDAETTGKTTKNSDVDAEVKPNVRTLIENYPKKRLDLSPRGRDQISLLMEQIQKMKSGLERLQEIAHQFNGSKRFEEDFNYLVNNIRPHLKKEDENNITPKNE